MALSKAQAKSRSVQGTQLVLKNLEKAIMGIEGRSQRGLTRAALMIRKQAQLNAPVVIGNLKASAFVVSRTANAATGHQAGGFKGENAAEMEKDHQDMIARETALASLAPGPYAEVGFTAKYAKDVHENPGAGKGAPNPNVPIYKRRSEVGGWKFLTRAVVALKGSILTVVKKEARV